MITSGMLWEDMELGDISDDCYLTFGSETAEYEFDVVNAKGCLRCTSNPENTAGYVRCGGKYKYLHRNIYHWYNEDKPEHIHHTCENKWCCNVGHLKGMTASDHIKHHAIKRGKVKNNKEKISKM